MERAKDEARAQGYVTTLFGRLCATPEINSGNPARRGYAERAAINAPIQGSAADIMRRAMIRADRALARSNLGARMLLQVHDELVFEVPEAEIEPTAELVRKVMERGRAPRRAAGRRRRPRPELGRRALTRVRAGGMTPALETLAQRVLSGDRRALARAITLIESRRPEHQAQAEALLGRLLPATGNAVRLGISGTPGAGKSTFIEALGAHLIEQGHQVAVLAVDPSSRRSGGSILGDKTRMQRLAQAPRGVHPALARGRHARRRHAAHARGRRSPARPPASTWC